MFILAAVLTTDNIVGEQGEKQVLWNAIAPEHLKQLPVEEKPL